MNTLLSIKVNFKATLLKIKNINNDNINPSGKYNNFK